MTSALVLLPEGFEELEAVAPIDVLRRAGVDVVVAGLTASPLVTGRCGMTLRVDTPLESVPAGRTFDLLLLPGGPGVKLLRADVRVRALVLAQHVAGRWLAAICAAPTVLGDAGLLTGRRYTCHPSVAAELPDRLADERVVVDGKIITSRGAGTAIDYGLVLAGLLVSPAQRDDVARAICA
jgi:4-methyl-5(b-hydroxyethyl)-thiazole monophosphate biosynthesis